MNAIEIPRRFALLAGLLALSGCFSRINEKHTFIASNPASQDLSIVRVVVEGYATGANMNFRAGFRDAKAVDEVLKGTSSLNYTNAVPDDSVFTAASAKITADLLAKLQIAYQLGQPAEVQRLEGELARAQSLARIVRAGETLRVPEAPAQKFIIAFSADPTAVFQKIANITARNENEGEVFKSWKLMLGSQQSAALQVRQAAEVTWQALLDPATKDLPPEAAAAATPEGHQQLRDQLLRYEARLQDFLHAKP